MKACALRSVKAAAPSVLASFPASQSNKETPWPAGLFRRLFLR